MSAIMIFLSKIDMRRTHYIGSVVYPIKGVWSGTLSHYQLFYMANSSSEVTYHNKKYQTPSKSIYLMYPNVPYVIEFNKQQESVHYWISYHDHAHLLNKLQLLQEEFYQFTGVEVFQQYMDLALTYRSHEEFQNFAHLFLLNFLETYADFCLERSKLRETFSDKVILSINYLRKNYTKSISLDILSKEVHTTPEHLIRLFRKSNLPSPMTYLRELRVNRAIDLMRSTNLSFKEIGEQVGLPDPYQFSKLVKKVSGRSARNIRSE